MRLWKDESGQAMVMTVVSMGVLLGFLALAADVGSLYRAKRNLQIVADAAATAGALDYLYTVNSSFATTAATQAAGNNGVVAGTAGGLTTAVTVTTPVTSGPHTGAGYVEVDISQQQRTTLMSYFGFNNVNVAVKAVAGQVQNQGCIFLMGSGDVLKAQGSAKIAGWDPVAKKEVTGCGVYARSNIGIKGNGNTFNVAYVEASGVLDANGNSNTNPAPVVQNSPIQQIPKALQITPPAPASFATCNPPAGYTTSTSGHGKNQITVYTATLTGTIPSGTCYGLGGADPTTTQLNINVSGAQFPNGLTVFDLGTANGGGTLTLGNNVSGGSQGPGVAGMTIDINTGNFSVTSTTNDQLYAPSDGALDTYNGVLLLEPSSNTGKINIQWGSSSGQFVGIIDAPGATATMQDQGGSGTLVTGLVLGALDMQTSTLYVQNYGSVYTGSPLNSVALVE